MIRQSGVIVAPSVADSHLDSSFAATADNAFIIAASGVTIEDLTIDGNANLALAGTQNFRNAIITNSQNDSVTYDNTTVENVTAQNIFRKGIALYSERHDEHPGNVVEFNTLDSIGSVINDSGNAYEATAAIAAFGSNVDIEHNTITHSAGGIEANDTSLLTITNNQISLPQTTLSQGALGIDLAALAGSSSVSDNTIDLTGSATNDDIGIVISFANGSVSVSGNNVTARIVTMASCCIRTRFPPARCWSPTTRFSSRAPIAPAPVFC